MIKQFENQFDISLYLIYSSRNITTDSLVIRFHLVITVPAYQLKVSGEKKTLTRNSLSISLLNIYKLKIYLKFFSLSQCIFLFIIRSLHRQQFNRSHVYFIIKYHSIQRSIIMDYVSIHSIIILYTLISYFWIWNKSHVNK